MKKKSSHLKNLRNILKQQEKINNFAQGIRQRIELPKIEASTFQTLMAKKTLMVTITKIEEYIESTEKQPPSIINDCLHFLRQQLKNYTSFLSSGVRKTEASEASPLKENEWNSQSQIFNVNMNRMRKVASKDLFEKVATVKYSQGAIINIREQEVISALKSKLSEKDLTIKRLHNHIEELQIDIVNLKKELQSSQTLNSKLREEQKRQENELNQIKIDNQAKSEAKWELTESVSKLEENNVQWRQKYKIISQQLREKEAQIVAFWRMHIQQEYQ